MPNTADSRPVIARTVWQSSLASIIARAGHVSEGTTNDAASEGGDEHCTDRLSNVADCSNGSTTLSRDVIHAALLEVWAAGNPNGSRFRC